MWLGGSMIVANYVQDLLILHLLSQMATKLHTNLIEVRRHLVDEREYNFA